MKALLSIPLLLAATHAGATCFAERPVQQPELIDGSVATEAEMQATQDAVNAYVDQVAAFLDCNESRLHDVEHNFYVSKAFGLAEAYNTELQQYRSQDVVAGR